MLWATLTAMPPDETDGPALDGAAARLHEEFDAGLGPEVVDRQVAQTAERFASARVRTFVPLLVRRYAGEALRDLQNGLPAPDGVPRD